MTTKSVLLLAALACGTTWGLLAYVRGPESLCAIAFVAAIGLGATGFLVGTGNESGFCAKHHCIDSFDSGTGSIVQCADRLWSHSGGHSGACSHHGGVVGARDLDLNDPDLDLNEPKVDLNEPKLDLGSP